MFRKNLGSYHETVYWLFIVRPILLNIVSTDANLFVRVCVDTKYCSRKDGMNGWTFQRDEVNKLLTQFAEFGDLNLNGTGVYLGCKLSSDCPCDRNSSKPLDTFLYFTDPSLSVEKTTNFSTFLNTELKNVNNYSHMCGDAFVSDFPFGMGSTSGTFPTDSSSRGGSTDKATVGQSNHTGSTDKTTANTKDVNIVTSTTIGYDMTTEQWEVFTFEPHLHTTAFTIKPRLSTTTYVNPPEASQQKNDTPDKATSTATIAGAAVGAVAGFGLLAALAGLLYRKLSNAAKVGDSSFSDVQPIVVPDVGFEEAPNSVAPAGTS